MKVTWQAEDGYCGGARPHTTKIDDEDIAACETVEVAMGLVEDCITEDFANTVSPGWDYKKALAEVKAIIVKAKAEELLE
jgi:hypothetical protein